MSSNEYLKNLEIVLDQANILGIVAVASQNEEARTMLSEMCERNKVPSHVLTNLYWDSYPSDECPHGDNNHINLIRSLKPVSPIIFGSKEKEVA